MLGPSNQGKPRDGGVPLFPHSSSLSSDSHQLLFAELLNNRTSSIDEYSSPGQSRGSPTTAMSTRPCRFFRAGNCRNGAYCHYYHDGFSSLPASALEESSGVGESDEEETSISPGHRTEQGVADPVTLTASTSTSSRPAYAASRPCQWYMAGYCHRGESCWFSHDRGIIHATYNGGEEGAVLNNDSEQGTGVIGQITGVVDNEEEDEDQKCAICFEVPKTFGLLVSCNHAFCLTCIRTWRSKEVSAELQPHDSTNVSVTKACPNCRTPSLYVVPSSLFPSCSEQKEIIIQNYKEATARKPCKYFKNSGDRHWCPFGDDCHFAHLDADGEPCKVNPDSNPRLNRQRRSRNGHSRYNPTIAQMRRGVFEAIRGVSRSSDDDYDGLRALLMELSRLRTDLASEGESWTRSNRQPNSHNHNNYGGHFEDEVGVQYLRDYGLEFVGGVYDADDDDDDDDYEYGYDDEDSEDDSYFDDYYEDQYVATARRI